MKLDLAQISRIETLAANALPSYHTEHKDGWRFRYNHGVTRRANSVLAEQAGNLSLDAKLKRVEAWYRTLGVKARFQLCPASQPLGLQEILLERGYSRHSGANVQTARPEDVLKKEARAGFNVTIAESCTEAWLSLYQRAEQASDEHIDLRRKMLERIKAKTAFVTTDLNGQEAAVGLAVYEAQHAGIFNMATLKNMRKKGAATATLCAIANWAKEQTAQHLYLQVASENSVAQTAYASFGFETLYAYEYFEQS